MLNRRGFIKKVALAGAGISALPLMASSNIQKITILHTNDLHCHFEPFSLSDPKYPGKGGMNRISAYVKKMRQVDPNLLLLDCGDFSQGTPYYNFFKGEVVLKLMTEMGYDASTIGNHEFDNGIESLNKALKYADFPLVSSNYDFSKTLLKDEVKSNFIIERKGIRIGIYGIGIELKGLVGSSLYGNTVHNDPIETALVQEEILRNKEKCDLIICLSHLGFNYTSPKVSDNVLAKSTRYTDLILGGHTHTFLEEPIEVLNVDKQPVIINQAGWAALMLGQLDFYFERYRKPIFDMSANKSVGK